MRTHSIKFENSQGITLSARLDEPATGVIKHYALFAHCFTCHKNLKAIQHISHALTAQGIALFRIDFTGLGDSGGAFADTSIVTNIEDLITASHYLSTHYQAPKLMIGHSFGGAAAILAATQLNNIQAVATIASPASVDHVEHLFAGKTQDIQAQGQAELSIGGRNIILGKPFLDALYHHNLSEELAQLRKPILVFHSPQDTIVGIDNAQKIYTSAKHPKSFVSLDGADHLLSQSSDACYVGDVMAAWAKRYISADTQTSTPQNTHVNIQGNRAAGYTCEIRAGEHSLYADEPKVLGGNNLGATPYELLLSSLGACTAMTMKMYAQRKGWAFEDIDVQLTHEKINKTTDEGVRKVDVIHRKINIKSALDDKQLAGIKAIADKCPVHKSLTDPVDIITVFTPTA